MPSTRRKSVAFAEPNDEPPATRTRRSGASADPAPAAPAAAAKPKKRVEADGGFKFKRSKAARAAVAPDEPVPTVAESAPPAAAAAEVAPEKASPQPAIVEPEPSRGGAATAPPTAPVLEAVVPPTGPTLDGQPHHVLHALFEECLERKANAQHGAAPEKMELAVEACLAELRRQGVHRVPAAESESTTLRAREAVLERRLSELQLAQRSWDAAATRSTEASRAIVALAEAQLDAPADAAVLQVLPPLPDIAGGLQQLQGLAVLCADQLSGAVQRAERTVKQCGGEQQRLAQAVHKAAFNGYLDVEQPQSLLRSVAAA